MCPAVRSFFRMLGRRGVFLLIIGIGETSWGISFLVTPPQPPLGLGLLIQIGPLQHWGWLWITAGAITAGSAFLRIGRDGWGFLAAYIPPSVWAMAFLAAAASGDYPRGAFVALWHLTSHVGVILWASTVPEHSVPHPRKARKGTRP